MSERPAEVWKDIVWAICIVIIMIMHTGCSAQQKTVRRLVFSDDFEHGLDTTVWITEIEPLPSSRVYTQDGKLIMDTRGGVTVWLNKKLKRNIEITFTRRVLTSAGPNDRLSDMNQFWMAEDPRNANLFCRTGKFEEYDSLRMYYVGIGGNTNTTTRFRKYEGNGERRLLQEYSDEDHLLSSEKQYDIRIEVKNNLVEFYVNGKRYFSLIDDNVLKQGYFGLRTTWSHQEVDDIRIFEIESENP